MIKNAFENKRVILYLLICVPFFLNDFSNIFLYDHYKLWLLIDYVFTKILILGYVFYLLHKGVFSCHDLGLRGLKLKDFLFWTVFMSVVGLFFDQIGGKIFELILPITQLGNFPKISNSFIYKIDLYGGLILVGFVEEIVFRGIAFTVLYEKFNSIFKVFIFSSVIFGLIHWSLGVGSIINTTIIGLVFMVARWRTKSIFPLVLAHFIVDYVVFSGVNFNQFFISVIPIFF